MLCFEYVSGRFGVRNGLGWGRARSVWGPIGGGIGPLNDPPTDPRGEAEGYNPRFHWNNQAQKNGPVTKCKDQETKNAEYAKNQAQEEYAENAMK